MQPAKKPRSSMAVQGRRSSVDKLFEEARHLRLEVEPVIATTVASVPKRGTHSPMTNATTTVYRPTYRAVLAKKGFVVRDTLGAGTYSKVRWAYNLNHYTDKVAVKIIDRSKAPQDYQTRFLPRELRIWPKLHHRHLIHMYEYFEDSKRVYIIQEYAPGGDALKYIQSHGAVSEAWAKIWIRQIADAVKYLHQQDICHRDLKLENLLLDVYMNIKICDFGFVRDQCKHDMSKTYCGSKSYASPEILMGTPYEARKADIWAMGVILYIFVTGSYLFLHYLAFACASCHLPRVYYVYIQTDFP